MKIIIFINFFLILNAILIKCYPLKMLTRRSCGPLLVNRVKLICSKYGGYNHLNTDGENRRVKRGIVDECCHRVCDDKDIAQYCVSTGLILDNHNKFDIFQAFRQIPESQEFEEYKEKIDRKMIITPPNTTSKTNLIHPLRSLPGNQIGTVSPEFMRTAAIYRRS